jgi:hypothetical protein
LEDEIMATVEQALDNCIISFGAGVKMVGVLDVEDTVAEKLKAKFRPDFTREIAYWLAEKKFVQYEARKIGERAAQKAIESGSNIVTWNHAEMAADEVKLENASVRDTPTRWCRLA